MIIFSILLLSLVPLTRSSVILDVHLQASSCRENIADSREHIPSKVFLDRPYSIECGIVPSCIKCNNNFSQDELYVSCFVDKLRSVLTNSKIPIREKTIKALEHDKKLYSKIDSEISVVNERITVKPDYVAFNKILIKLSKGHWCHDQDCVLTDGRETICAFKFKPDFNESEMHNFEELPIINIAGDVGSNNTHSLLVVEGNGTEPIIVVPWTEIQENNYRFLTYYKANEFVVKIVVFEMLYAEVKFIEN